MKKLLTLPNIQVVLFTTLSIVETVILLLFRPIHVGYVVTIQILALMNVVSLRFNYQLARLRNRLQANFARKHLSDEADEPSDYILYGGKVSSYIIFLLLQIGWFI